MTSPLAHPNSPLALNTSLDPLWLWLRPLTQYKYPSLTAAHPLLPGFGSFTAPFRTVPLSKSTTSTVESTKSRSLIPPKHTIWFSTITPAYPSLREPKVALSCRQVPSTSSSTNISFKNRISSTVWNVPPAIAMRLPSLATQAEEILRGS